MENDTPLNLPTPDDMSLDFLVELGIVGHDASFPAPVVPIAIRTSTGLHVVSLEEQLGDLMEQSGLSVADLVGVEIPEPPEDEPEEETEDFDELVDEVPVRGRSFGYGYLGQESIQSVEYYNNTEKKADPWEGSLQNSRHVLQSDKYEFMVVDNSDKKFARQAAALGGLILSNYLEQPESELPMTINTLILPERTKHKTFKSPKNNIESHTYTKLESV